MNPIILTLFKNCYIRDHILQTNRLRSMLISAEKKKEGLTSQNKEKEQKIDRYIKEIEDLDAENQK